MPDFSHPSEKSVVVDGRSCIVIPGWELQGSLYVDLAILVASLTCEQVFV